LPLSSLGRSVSQEFATADRYGARAVDGPILPSPTKLRQRLTREWSGTTRKRSLQYRIRVCSLLPPEQLESSLYCWLPSANGNQNDNDPTKNTEDSRRDRKPIGCHRCSRERSYSHSAVTAAARRGPPVWLPLQFGAPKSISCCVSVLPPLL